MNNPENGKGNIIMQNVVFQIFMLAYDKWIIVLSWVWQHIF